MGPGIGPPGVRCSGLTHSEPLRAGEGEGSGLSTAHGGPQRPAPSPSQAASRGTTPSRNADATASSSIPRPAPSTGADAAAREEGQGEAGLKTEAPRNPYLWGGSAEKRRRSSITSTCDMIIRRQQYLWRPRRSMASFSDSFCCETIRTNCSCLFPTTLPHVKQRTGMIIGRDRDHER